MSARLKKLTEKRRIFTSVLENGNENGCTEDQVLHVQFGP